MRRLIPAFVLALVALFAGCANDSGTDAATPQVTGNPSASAGASAADHIAKIHGALERSFTSPLTLYASVRGGGVSMNLSGKADVPGRRLVASGYSGGPFECRQVGDTMYVKMEAFKAVGPWIKIDAGKLRPDSLLRRTFDVNGQGGVLGGIATVEEVGGGRYRGTADLEKAAAAASNDDMVQSSLRTLLRLSSNPERVYFEVTLDAQDRLTDLSYTISLRGGGDMISELALSRFGEPVTVSAPPSKETAEATTEMYAVL